MPDHSDAIKRIVADVIAMRERVDSAAKAWASGAASGTVTTFVVNEYDEAEDVYSDRVFGLAPLMARVVAAALPCADDDADAKDRLVLREALDELAKEGGSDA